MSDSPILPKKEHKNITPILIEDEMKRSYLDYAMSVIIGRALPDVRDGLKPVHRRVLFAMNELHNDWNKPHKKSARIVGDVIGKYHPHGDTAVYDTIVRMAQTFSMRYILIDGQGNFGSIDGDSAAAMRYTEIRMSKLAHTLLEDLDKDTVDFAPNYDGSEFAPVVLPARVPNLLINGSSGIAVGMATNIPPHNLTEVINACLALINDPEIDIDTLITHITGPDFPTAGIINGRFGILQAYRTGRGKIYIRARASVEEGKGDRANKQSIIITELPYQVNKARLLEKIAELIKEKRVDGITAIRDESDKDGMRVVVEVRRGENAEVLLNNLYALTQMQVVFGINMVTLSDGQPHLMNLKQILEAFIKHRREVVTRRTLFELSKARKRAHILEGLGIALSNIDVMIQLIKESSTPSVAREKLLSRSWPPGLVAELLTKEATVTRPEDLDIQYGLIAEQYNLSPEQAQAILDLRLHRLTGLEQDKILSEYKEILANIHMLLEILANPNRLMEVIREDLISIREQFGDGRLTEILNAQLDYSSEDLIDPEDVVVTISQLGYAKIQSLDLYQAQHRGGKGKTATNIKDEDYIKHLLIANTHDTILCFSSRGQVYWLKVYQLPQAGRGARGKPIINLLPLTEGEIITAILPLRQYLNNQYLFMATASGIVKKVALDLFSRPRSNGVIAIDLDENDALIGVGITQGSNEIMLFTNTGKVIRFDETDVRAVGRTARGVRGIKLQAGQRVISLVIPQPDRAILTATENGYGKRTVLDDYRSTGRGGQGVISIQVSERNGNVIAADQVIPTDEVLLISDKGTLVRIRAADISLVGRNTQGVRLIRLHPEEHLIGMTAVPDLGDIVPDLAPPLEGSFDAGLDSGLEEEPEVSMENNDININ